MAEVNPYLTFNGNCERAFLFYREVFGGAFIHFSRFGEVEDERSMAAAEGKKIMHVSLPIGNGTILMGSDLPESFGEIVVGQNIAVSISASSEVEARALYTALSAGGNITLPLEKTFWGALFGLFSDQFGIQWMINYDYTREN
ncbi:MAG: VOC family protein [Chitinophagaceae bacterium]